MNSPIVDSIFTALKAAEELAYPNAKILQGFRRVIQLDGFIRMWDKYGLVVARPQ